MLKFDCLAWGGARRIHETGLWEVPVSEVRNPNAGLRHLNHARDRQIRPTVVVAEMTDGAEPGRPNFPCPPESPTFRLYGVNRAHASIACFTYFYAKRNTYIYPTLYDWQVVMRSSRCALSSIPKAGQW